MKLVVVDPVLSAAAAKSDEWVPITPGTDGAFALGLLNALVNEYREIDAEFIKRYTNGPYLVLQDGYFARKDGKPLMFDEADSKLKAFDEVGIKSPSISGEFQVDGLKCVPAFELLAEHLKQYTPSKSKALLASVPVI